MTRRNYLDSLKEAYEAGRISAEAYDIGIANTEIFSFDEEESYGLPEHYAEIEYSDFDSVEAIDGARFDDINLIRYMER